MVEDNPIQDELEKMFLFCRNHRQIYIYEHNETQKLISKYLYFAKIHLEGFLKYDVSPHEQEDEPFKIFTFNELNQKKFKSKVGIIVAADSMKETDVTNFLKQNTGVKDFFVMSEWNTRTIPYKMTPRAKENFWVEVNLADHCNLNCQCCDHFSPLAKPTYLDFNQYVKDLKRLSDLTDNKIGLIKLQGGEPLLNSNLIEFIKVTREIFPNAFICLFTAGLLLRKWGSNLWKAVKDYEIEVRWTHYPININIEEIKKQVVDYGIEWWDNPPPFTKGARVWLFSEIGALNYKGVKHSVKHPFALEGNVEPFRWISCYQFNESIVLRDGKIYTCPMIPYIHYFNDYFNVKLEVKDDCYIDIYNAKSYEEIAEFCTHRTSFCDYCAVHHRYPMEWKQSEHSIDEWVETKMPIISLFKRGCYFLKANGIKSTINRCYELFLK